MLAYSLIINEKGFIIVPKSSIGAKIIFIGADLFIYPKYNIETRGGIFGNRSKATINAKGAILK